MMAATGDHRAAVINWFERAAQGRSVAAMLEAFELAFSALWQRSHLALGEVTLTAIVERVLVVAKETFPVLAPLDVDGSGLRCQGLRSQPGLRDGQLSAAVQFVLVEFLTVLGNLIAEILTPALHAELSKLHAGAGDRGANEEQGS
jgi:hypothetical protein